MIFSKELFDKMIINPFGEDFKMDDYREKLNEIMGGVWKKRSASLEKAVKYILYMYDIGSPMRRQYSNMEQRKEECAVLAGFKLEREKDRNDAQKLYEFKDDIYTDFVVNFLKYQHNKTWALLVSNEEVLFQIQSELMKPVTNSKGDKETLQGYEVKDKLMERCDSIIKRIEAYEDKIFGQDKLLLEKVKSAPITPEQIALNV